MLMRFSHQVMLRTAFSFSDSKSELQLRIDGKIYTKNIVKLIIFLLFIFSQFLDMRNLFLVPKKYHSKFPKILSYAVTQLRGYAYGIV